MNWSIVMSNWNLFLFLIPLSSAFVSHPQLLSTGNIKLRYAGRIPILSQVTGLHMKGKGSQEGRRQKPATGKEEPRSLNVNLHANQNQRGTSIIRESLANEPQNEADSSFVESDVVVPNSKQATVIGSFAASTQVAPPVHRQGIEGVAAQHPYNGYFSPHPFEEPERIGQEWSLSCPLCTTVMISPYRSNCIANLNAHVKTVHDKVRDFKCPSCGYATGQKSSLMRHLKTCRKIRLSELPVAAQHPFYEYWSPHPFEEPQRVDQEWRVGCPLCTVVSSAVFRSTCITNLNGHVKTVHDKVRDFKCPSCDFATGRKSYLSRHVKTCRKSELAATPVAAQHPYYGYWSPHPFEEPQRVDQEWRVGCPLCPVVKNAPYRSTCIANLNTHVKLVHDKVRDFKCPSCDFATGQKSALQQHLRGVHPGEVSREGGVVLAREPREE